MERVLFEFDLRKINQTAEVIIESRGKKEDQTLAQRYNELLYKGSGYQIGLSQSIIKKRQKRNRRIWA